MSKIFYCFSPTDYKHNTCQKHPDNKDGHVFCCFSCMVATTCKNSCAYFKSNDQDKCATLKEQIDVDN